MKISSLKESILCWALKSLETIIRILPYPVALGLGRALGTVYAALSPRKRGVVYKNLKIAFADTKSPAQLRALVWDVFRTFGQKFTELVKLAGMTDEERSNLIRIEGREHIDRSMAQGQGVIVMTMHFGSWEIVNFLFSRMGYEYKTFANDPKRYPKLDEMLNAYRRRLGGGLLSPETGVKDFLQSLKQNSMVAMLTDLGGRDGIPVPFFGRTASMSIGAVRVGLKGVPVCFAVVVPEGRGRYRVIVHEPMTLTRTDNPQQDVEDNCRAVSQLMETYVRQYPQEYMWFYKVWKYSDQRKVTLLTDGKAGHFNQTLRISKTVNALYQERGLSVETNVIKVEYSHPLASKILLLLSWIMPTDLIPGRLQWIKPFVTPETWKSLSASSCDVVISTGSAAALVNHWICRENNARSICVLKPSGLPYGFFNAVILPRHDVRGEPERPVVATEAALNMIDEVYLNVQKEKLLNRFSHLKGRIRPRIGVLIGGSSREVYLTSYHIKILMHQMRHVAREMNAEMLITTSRRTSPSIERFLLKHLKNDETCSLLILPSRMDVPEALGGILGLSDLIVVSGDSISMVSEAVATEKKVVVFYPGIRTVLLRFLNKHKRFLDRMGQQGLIAACDVKHVGEMVLGVSKKKIVTRKGDDLAVIRAAIEKIL